MIQWLDKKERSADASANERYSSNPSKYFQDILSRKKEYTFDIDKLREKISGHIDDIGQQHIR